MLVPTSGATHPPHYRREQMDFPIQKAMSFIVPLGGLIMAYLITELLSALLTIDKKGGRLWREIVWGYFLEMPTKCRAGLVSDAWLHCCDRA